MKSIKNIRTGARRVAVASAAATLALAGVWVSTAEAQQTAPPGTVCTHLPVDSALQVNVPGPHDLTILELADGSEVSFYDTVNGQLLVSPNGVAIVSVYKCDFVDSEVVVAPEPTPATVTEQPTDETTAVPETTPVPETAVPQSEVVVSVPEAPAESTPEVVILAAQPSPDAPAEDSGPQALAVTGVESALLVILGAALIGAGLIFKTQLRRS